MSGHHYNPERYKGKTRLEPFGSCAVELPKSLLDEVEKYREKSGKLKHEIFTEALLAYFKKAK